MSKLISNVHAGKKPTQVENRCDDKLISYVKFKNMKNSGAWVAHLVACPTFGFRLSHDLMVHGF